MAAKTPLNHRVQKYFIPELEKDLYKRTLCHSNKSVSGKKNESSFTCPFMSSRNIGKFEWVQIRTTKKKRLKIIQSLAEIVTVNGRPFNCLMDSGLIVKKENDLEVLDSAGFGIILNKNLIEIKKYVKMLSHKIQKILSLEVKSRSLSLLLDIGSRNGVSILGIGIQYMKYDIVYNKPIGMIPLQKSHTAAYIIEELKMCLESYPSINSY